MWRTARRTRRRCTCRSAALEPHVLRDGLHSRRLTARTCIHATWAQGTGYRQHRVQAAQQASHRAYLHPCHVGTGYRVQAAQGTGCTAGISPRVTACACVCMCVCTCVYVCLLLMLGVHCKLAADARRACTCTCTHVPGGRACCCHVHAQMQAHAHAHMYTRRACCSTCCCHVANDPIERTRCSACCRDAARPNMCRRHARHLLFL